MIATPPMRSHITEEIMQIKMGKVKEEWKRGMEPV
jgi:hypothetical protein